MLAFDLSCVSQCLWVAFVYLFLSKRCRKQFGEENQVCRRKARLGSGRAPRWTSQLYRNAGFPEPWAPEVWFLVVVLSHPRVLVLAGVLVPPPPKLRVPPSAGQQLLGSLELPRGGGRVLTGCTFQASGLGCGARGREPLAGEQTGSPQSCVTAGAPMSGAGRSAELHPRPQGCLGVSFPSPSRFPPPRTQDPRSVPRKPGGKVLGKSGPEPLRGSPAPRAPGLAQVAAGIWPSQLCPGPQGSSHQGAVGCGAVCTACGGRGLLSPAPSGVVTCPGLRAQVSHYVQERGSNDHLHGPVPAPFLLTALRCVSVPQGAPHQYLLRGHGSEAEPGQPALACAAGRALFPPHCVTLVQEDLQRQLGEDRGSDVVPQGSGAGLYQQGRRLLQWKPRRGRDLCVCSPGVLARPLPLVGLREHRGRG